MEDYILREIDRLAEMLMLIARKLGLMDGDTPDYSLTDVKDALLKDALAYLDGKGYFSFRLHALSSTG